jgi:hypothetical protein
VDGPSVTRFLLECVKQPVVDPSFRTKLREKLCALASREIGESATAATIAAQRASLAETKRKREHAAQNLALAENEEQHRVIAEVFERLR